MRKPREPQTVRRVRERAGAVSQRGREWAEKQEPGSRAGVAISAWRHYRAVDGPLQSALLSLYILVAVLPALLVMEEYLDKHPNSLANSIVHHYRLNGSTATLIRNVLAEGTAHKLGSALLAIVGALIFGLGFGRVLQLVHARAWQLTLPSKQTDQILYGIVLAGLYGLILLLLVQLTELSGSPAWVGRTLALGWVVVLVLFFIWAPRVLTHRLLSWRDLLPSAVLTAIALVVIMIISRYVMRFWIDLYASDYGGLGVVLAIYFWIAFSSGAIVWAASLSPALAARREFRRSS
jgi:membrane protein